MHRRSRAWPSSVAAAIFITGVVTAPGVQAQPQPDLVVKSVSNPPGFREPGQSLTLKESVKNTGDKQAGRSVTRYFLSEDNVKGPSDIQLRGDRSVGRLEPNGKSSGAEVVEVPGSVEPFLYYVLACADATTKVAEKSEQNNCRTARSRMLVEQDDSAAPDPLTVEPTLANDAAATEEFGAEAGGVLTATGSDGTTYTLTIPSRALIEDVEITMTPVASIGDLDQHMSGGLKGGVALRPEGLRLFKPATLLIEPPSAIPLESQDAFTYEGNGTNFHLYPLDVDTEKISFNLLHFSDYGIGGATEAERQLLGQRLPPSREGQLEADVADVVDRLRRDEISQDTFLADFSDIALEHFFRHILPELAAARGRGDNDGGLVAVDLFTTWRHELELIGLEDYFNERYRVNMGTLIDYGFEQVRGVARFLFNVAWGRCRRSQNRPLQLERMTGWGRMAEIHLGGGSEVLGSDFESKVHLCGSPKGIVGEIQFESTYDATTESSGSTITVHVEREGTLDVVFKKGERTTEQKWIDNGSTFSGTFSRTVEGVHNANECHFDESAGGELDGTIANMNPGAAFQLVFDPSHYPTKNGALWFRVTSNDSSHHNSHQDFGVDKFGEPCTHSENQTGQAEVYQVPTCPIDNFPLERPGSGMRGAYKKDDGIVTLDFKCAGTFTYPSAGTETFNVSEFLTVGSMSKID